MQTGESFCESAVTVCLHLDAVSVPGSPSTVAVEIQLALPTVCSTKSQGPFSISYIASVSHHCQVVELPQEKEH